MISFPFYISINDIIIRIGKYNISLIYYGEFRKACPVFILFPALKYIYNDTLLNQ
jgi:hypothetical protein